MARSALTQEQVDTEERAQDRQIILASFFQLLFEVDPRGASTDVLRDLVEGAQGIFAGWRGYTAHTEEEAQPEREELLPPGKRQKRQHNAEKDLSGPKSKTAATIPVAKGRTSRNSSGARGQRASAPPSTEPEDDEETPDPGADTETVAATLNDRFAAVLTGTRCDIEGLVDTSRTGLVVSAQLKRDLLYAAKSRFAVAQAEAHPLALGLAGDGAARTDHQLATVLSALHRSTLRALPAITDLDTTLADTTQETELLHVREAASAVAESAIAAGLASLELFLALLRLARRSSWLDLKDPATAMVGILLCTTFDLPERLRSLYLASLDRVLDMQGALQSTFLRLTRDGREPVVERSQSAAEKRVLQPPPGVLLDEAERSRYHQGRYVLQEIGTSAAALDPQSSTDAPKKKRKKRSQASAVQIYDKDEHGHVRRKLKDRVSLLVIGASLLAEGCHPLLLESFVTHAIAHPRATRKTLHAWQHADSRKAFSALLLEASEGIKDETGSSFLRDFLLSSAIDFERRGADTFSVLFTIELQDGGEEEPIEHLL